MYDECDGLMLFAGEVVGVIHITSGSKKGCPMSGSLLALSLDPFLRRVRRCAAERGAARLSNVNP